MSNLVVVLMGGLSGERKISFLSGKTCSKALKKKGYKVITLDAKGYFVEELKKLKPKIVFNALLTYLNFISFIFYDFNYWWNNCSKNFRTLASS